MSKQDEELIAEYQQGNDEALNMLFHRYKMPVFNFALRLLGNRAEAEDAASEVFLVLVSKKEAYQPKAKFSTWLFTVTRNACIDRIRKRKNIFSLWFTNSSGEQEQWEIPDDDGETAAEHAARRETAHQVKSVIELLPPMQKEALILREYQGLKYEEIAHILGCSLENVKVLIFRARERLRVELASSILEDGDE